MRTLLLPLVALTALSLGACNKPDVKDSAVAFPTAEDLGDGTFGNLIGVGARIGPETRVDMETFELSFRIGIAYNTDNPPSGGIQLLAGFLEEIGSGGISDGGAEVTWEGAPFKDCTGAGMSETEDGGCFFEGVAIVGIDRAVSYVATFDVRAWGPDDYEGDPEVLDIETAIEVAQPDETSE